MSDNHFRIAFAPLARPTFDIPLAQLVTEQALEELQKAGFELFTTEDMIADLDGVQSFLSGLDESGECRC